MLLNNIHSVIENFLLMIASRKNLSNLYIFITLLYCYKVKHYIGSI